MRNLHERATELIEERPGALIAFYIGGGRPDYRRRARNLHAAGERWLRMWDMGHVPTVALCWPREHIERFLAWLPEGYRFKDPIIDDGATASYCKAHRPELFATVPSLVEHPDTERSLMGKVARAGGNRARVAALFFDD